MNVGDVIRTIQLRFTTEGEQKATAALKGVQSAQEQLAKSSAHTAQVTETSARHQLSMANSMERLERRFNQTARAQFEYERVQKQVNAAVAQNPALQARANDVLARAAAHYATASAAQSTYSRGLQLAGDQAAMFAGRAGAAGGALAGLGPAGIAAGAGLGAAALAGTQLVKMVNDLADKSGKLVDFAETTGLTTTQLQTLNKAGAEVGLTSDKIGQGFERFTSQLNEARDSSGKLYETMRRIDPALASQLSGARSTAEAWDVLAMAIARADINQRNALARAAFGRSGFGMTRLANVSNQAGGLAALEQPRYAPSPEELRRWDDLKDKVDYLRGQAGTVFASMFADDVLNAQLRFYETLLRIAEWQKNFSTLLPDWWKYVESIKELGQLQLLMGNPLGIFAGAEAPAGTDLGKSLGRDQIDTSGDQPTQLARSLGLEDIGVVTQANQALQSQINIMKELHGVMGAAVTPTEQFQLKILELDLALQKQIITTEQYNRARAALQQQQAAPITALQNQLALSQTITAQERMAVQQRITYNQVLRETGDHERASLQALLERQVTQAQINSGAQGQLLALQDQHTIISATTETERLRAQEVARTNELIRQNVDASLAASIAAQERLNAEKQIAVAADQAAAAFRRQADAAAAAAASAAAAAAAADDAAWMAGTGQYSRHVPGKATVHVTNPMMKGYEQLLQDEYGGGGTVSQGTYHIPGKSGFIRHGYWFGGGVEPNEQGLEFSLNKRMESTLRSSGSLEAALNVAKAAPFDRADNLLQNLYQRIIDEKGETPEAEKFIEQELAFLKTKPRTFERDDLIKSLTDSLDNLRESTDALNGTIGLDPLYTQGHGYVGIGYNPHGGTSPRIPIDPNTQPYVPSLTQSTGTGGPMIQNAPVGGSITSPGRQLTDPLGRTVSGGSITSPGSTMIDPRTGRPIFGAAAGGMFMVGGAGGIDSKYVPLALTPGELIEVTPERETHHLGGKQQTVVNNVTHNNTFNFPPSRSYGDRRSQRHLTEGFGRAMAQAN